MLNKCVFMGRLTRDPELRQTGSGVDVANWTLAVDRDYKNGDEKVCDFIDCVAWRNTAQFVSKYFTKGRMMVVSGSLQSRKWQDKDGNNRTGWEVQAENIYFGDSKRDVEQSGASGQFPSTPSGFAPVEPEGDLPF